MMKKICNTCNKERPIFVFDKEDNCDHCRRDNVRKESPKRVLTWSDIKAERNRLLSETDWSQLEDVPKVEKIKWRKYRRNLRKITKNSKTQKYPKDIKWPSKPK